MATTRAIAMTPTIPSRPVGPVRRVSRKAWPTAVRRHASSEHVERHQRAEDLRRDDPGRQPGRRLDRDEHEREQQDDERGDQEERRELPPSVEQLAESGEDG